MILSQRHKLHEKSHETALQENPNQNLQNSTSIFIKMDQAFDSVLIFDFQIVSQCHPKDISSLVMDVVLRQHVCIQRRRAIRTEVSPQFLHCSYKSFSRLQSISFFPNLTWSIQISDVYNSIVQRLKSLLQVVCNVCGLFKKMLADVKYFHSFLPIIQCPSFFSFWLKLDKNEQSEWIRPN